MATKQKKTAKVSKRRAQNKGIVLIKKANNLIESRYKFDIWETRVFLSVLTQIKREDTEFDTYRIWYKDIIKNFGLTSGDSYALLRGAAKSLMSKSVYVSYQNEGTTREKQYHILREIDYLQAGQEGRVGDEHEYIDVQVESKMKPFLLQLKGNFTAYDLENVVNLNIYPVRVYELLKQYESIGSRILQVDEMKTMFEVNDQYSLFGDFNRWIIKPAIKEINEHTDLQILKVEKIKEGRKIVALRFIFKPKTKTLKNESDFEPKSKVGEKIAPYFLDLKTPKTTDVQESKKTNRTQIEPIENEIFKEFAPVVVQNFGVTPSVFAELCREATVAQVAQAIRVTRRAKANAKIRSTVAGFFVNALKNGFTDEIEEALKVRQVEEEKLLLQHNIDKLTVELNAITNDKIRELVAIEPNLTQRAIDALSNSPTLRVFLNERENALGHALTVDDFRADKVLRDLVKGKIEEFYPEEFAEVKNHLLAELNELKVGLRYLKENPNPSLTQSTKPKR